MKSVCTLICVCRLIIWKGARVPCAVLIMKIFCLIRIGIDDNCQVKSFVRAEAASKSQYVQSNVCTDEKSIVKIQQNYLWCFWVSVARVLFAVSKREKKDVKSQHLFRNIYPNKSVFRTYFKHPLTSVYVLWIKIFPIFQYIIFFLLFLRWFFKRAHPFQECAHVSIAAHTRFCSLSIASTLPITCLRIELTVPWIIFVVGVIVVFVFCCFFFFFEVDIVSEFLLG